MLNKFAGFCVVMVNFKGNSNMFRSFKHDIENVYCMYDYIQQLYRHINITYGKCVKLIHSESMQTIRVSFNSEKMVEIADFINIRKRTLITNVILICKIYDDGSINGIDVLPLYRCKLRHNERLRLKIKYNNNLTGVEQVEQRMSLETISIPHGFSYPLLHRCEININPEQLQLLLNKKINLNKTYKNLSCLNDYIKRKLKKSNDIAHTINIAITGSINNYVWKITPDEIKDDNDIWCNIIFEVGTDIYGKYKILTYTVGGRTHFKQGSETLTVPTSLWTKK